MRMGSHVRLLSKSSTVNTINDRSCFIRVRKSGERHIFFFFIIYFNSLLLHGIVLESLPISA